MQSLDADTPLWVYGLSLALLGGYWLVRRGLEQREEIQWRKLGRKLRAKVEERELDVFGLSITEARREAERILQDGGAWECVPLEGKPSEGVHTLGPSLSDLFSEFERIEYKGHDIGLMFRDDLLNDQEYLSEGYHRSLCGGTTAVMITSTLDDQGALYACPGDERVHEVVYYWSAPLK